MPRFAQLFSCLVLLCAAKCAQCITTHSPKAQLYVVLHLLAVLLIAMLVIFVLAMVYLLVQKTRKKRTFSPQQEEPAGEIQQDSGALLNAA